MGGQQSPPDNRAAGCGLGHSGPPWSPRPRCRGCSRAPPGPAWAPEVSGARLPAVTPYCLGAAAASPQPSCRWASLRFACSPPAPAPPWACRQILGPRSRAAAFSSPPPPPRACWYPRARATSGQACPVAQIPRLGRSHSPDLPPLHTWNSSACLPDRAVSEAARLGLAAVGPRRLTSSHQGGVDFPETAGGGGGGITTSAPQAANPCLSTICSPTLRLESLRTRCTFDLTTAGPVAELCPKPLMWLSLVVTPGLLFHVQIFTFFCLSF